MAAVGRLSRSGLAGFPGRLFRREQSRRSSLSNNLGLGAPCSCSRIALWFLVVVVAVVWSTKSLDKGHIFFSLLFGPPRAQTFNF